MAKDLNSYPLSLLRKVEVEEKIIIYCKWPFEDMEE